jgi:GNAT superfamily N-acetyltransferase
MITITQAGLQDLDQAALLFDAYRQFYQQVPDLSAAKAFLKERIQNKESVIFLAYDGQEAVGFAQLYPIFTSVGLQRAWLLNDLFVDGKARRKGIAVQLLEAAKAYAKTTNSKWLLLETASDNFTAQLVYEKNGWKRVNDIFYQFDL